MFEGVLLCTLVIIMNTTENRDRDFYLRTQRLTLDRMALLKVAAVVATPNRAPVSAADILFW